MNRITKKAETINPETGEVVPGKKWQQQTFYYIDYKHFADVVKYRLHEMQVRTFTSFLLHIALLLLLRSPSI